MLRKPKIRYMLIGAAVGFAASVVVALLSSTDTMAVAIARCLLLLPANVISLLWLSLLCHFTGGNEGVGLITRIITSDILAFVFWTVFGGLCGWTWYGVRAARAAKNEAQVSAQETSPAAQRQQAKRNRSAVAGCLAVVAIPIIFAAAAMLYARCTVRFETTPDLAEVCKISHVPLDRVPSCTLLNSMYYHAGQGHNLMAKVKIDRSDVRTLLTLLPPDSETSTNDRYGMRTDGYHSRPPWWDPDSIHKLVAACVPDPDAPGIARVLISLDDPKRSLVYVEWFY